MGIGFSIDNNIDTENNNCLICWESVDYIDLIHCTRCNIRMHAYCEEVYRNGKGFCKCPHCQRIGTICN